MKPGYPIPISDYVAYDQRKQRWVDEHPNATPAEYQAAVRRIAEECGV